MTHVSKLALGAIELLNVIAIGLQKNAQIEEYHLCRRWVLMEGPKSFR